jgi:hypothetical protein
VHPSAFARHPIPPSYPMFCGLISVLMSNSLFRVLKARFTVIQRLYREGEEDIGKYLCELWKT